MDENFQIETPVTIEQIESTLTKAMRKDSNYWYLIDEAQIKNLPSGPQRLSKRIAKGLSNGNLEMPVFDFNNYIYHESLGTIRGEVLGTVTAESLKKAFCIAAIKYPNIFARVMDCNADAKDSDIILQLAVMGEVRFTIHNSQLTIDMTHSHEKILPYLQSLKKGTSIKILLPPSCSVDHLSQTFNVDVGTVITTINWAITWWNFPEDTVWKVSKDADDILVLEPPHNLADRFYDALIECHLSVTPIEDVCWEE